MSALSCRRPLHPGEAADHEVRLAERGSVLVPPSAREPQPRHPLHHPHPGGRGH